MTDDLDDLDDNVDDDGEGEGHAAVLCTTEALGTKFRFVATLDEALRLVAQPCPTPGCLGHTVVHRDGRGQLRTRPAADGHDVIARRRDVLRRRERLRLLQKRLYDAARMQQRRAAKRAQLPGANDDVDP